MKKPYASPSWNLRGAVASRADATIDLTDPAAGLGLSPSGDRLLGLELAAEDRLAPGDTWLRGDDLVAVYDLDDGRQIRASAMWRRLAGPPAAWEVVVSASTSLLESDPRVAVVCDVQTGTVAWGRNSDRGIVWTPQAAGDTAILPPQAQALLVTRPNDAVIVAVHPLDAPRIELVHTGDRLRIACRLFASTVEKGVLLRSRVRAAIASADAPAEAALMMESLAAAPPPLTS